MQKMFLLSRNTRKSRGCHSLIERWCSRYSAYIPRR